MIKFKSDFALGTATAAAQIEGGNVDSNWYNFCNVKGNILDGTHCKRANQHWLKYEEDIALLEELNIGYYRMSIDWARVEPKEGHFDESALLRYRKEIEIMKNKGIKTYLTFHHFSHPQWFEDKGAFTKAENIKFFMRYIEKTLEYVGDLVSEYATLNEPNVYALNTCLAGEWMQKNKSIIKTINCMNVFIAAHRSAYALIHNYRKEKGFLDTMVSYAHHVRHFTPKRQNNPIDKKGARLLSFLFQEGFFEAAALGNFRFPFKNILNLPKGPAIDMISLNYYTRGETKYFNDTVKENVPKSDLGWEIYPDGLIKEAQRCYNLIKLPIYVSENGCCDNEDAFRSLYIYDHLKAIVESDLPFKRYYHWCFLDNFEWSDGELPRFGMVYCDYETQERRLKNTAYFYKDMIQNHGITEEAYLRFVKPCKYHKDEVNVLREYLSEEDVRKRR
ncbi:MAG: family 1 glycosylhydrolase [Eubacteriales bacterium]|nr:family 1 glycosylhydrolase [Eubacteriales bacterium]